mgnify:CR=1 FL=1
MLKNIQKKQLIFIEFIKKDVISKLFKMKKLIKSSIIEHKKLLDIATQKLINEIDISSKLVVKTLKKSKTVFFAGNGGSAADSQHIAAELVGRFKKDRKPLKAIALTTDTSILSAIGNDFGFDTVFSRQLEALGTNGDLLICSSTSGNSPNILNALKTAKKNKIKTISLLGNNGGKCKRYSDIPIVIPSSNTARIQELHILVGHIICEIIDKNY